MGWADRHSRGVHASATEWILMDPSRARVFTESMSRSPRFRSKFGGLYATLTNALARLGVKELPVPNFIQDKITKVRAALKDEERLLGSVLL